MTNNEKKDLTQKACMWRLILWEPEGGVFESKKRLEQAIEDGQEEIARLRRRRYGLVSILREMIDAKEGWDKEEV